MSCTFDSVMRAWPRIVLTSRVSRSLKEEAITGAARSPGQRAKPRKYTLADDSIVRSRAADRGRLSALARVALDLPAFVALAGYAVAALPSARTERVAGSALIVGWLAHAVALALELGGVGRPVPGVRFGFAPALSITLWFVLAVYFVESRLVPILRVRRVLAVLGVVAVALALAYPGELFLQHNPFAPLHWLLGIASYGLFGAAVLHAGMLGAADRQMRAHAAPRPDGEAGLPLLRLERLTFQFVLAGFVALSATLLLGWWVTDIWRWDHKTVFSILAWLVFAALLIGRARFGWRGRRATRWVYAGAALLLLAYVGSRFVLEVVLHRPI
jgi:ABC-type uncharacterized transport system permease subunit